MPSSQTLFHVTHTRFDEPSVQACIDYLLAKGEGLRKSPNGSMGLWLSPFPEMCSKFGMEVATLSLAEGTRYAVMEYQHLYKNFQEVGDLSFEEQVHAHAGMGRALATVCDVLLVGDASQALGEVVVLNTDVIEAWTWQDAFAFQDHAKRSTTRFTDISIDWDASRTIANWKLSPEGEVVKARTRSLRP